MTSIAFCAGVIPLIMSSGAGSEMRRAMGMAVFSGMLGVTAFGIFLTPVFYMLLRSSTARRRARKIRVQAEIDATANPYHLGEEPEPPKDKHGSRTYLHRPACAARVDAGTRASDTTPDQIAGPGLFRPRPARPHVPEYRCHQLHPP